MSEGLEITEVKKRDLEPLSRLDAELYEKTYVEITRKLRSSPHTTLQHECSVIRKGIFDIKSSNYSEDGIPFVRISNLREMTIDMTDIAYIPEEIHAQNSKTALCRNDVVLSKTAVPAASLVSIDACNASQDTVAIKLKMDSVINSHYLVAFLNTKFGLLQMQKRLTGNVQMHLNLDECKSRVIIPVFSREFLNNIKSLFERSIELKKVASDTYSLAETYLLDLLGMRNFTAEESSANIVSVKESFLASGRLDAEYYHPKYEDYRNLITGYRGGYTTISKHFIKNKEKFDPHQSKVCTYIEIGDIDISCGRIQYNERNVDELPANAKISVKQGDLLISTVRPNRGAVAIVDRDSDNLVASGAFAVLRRKGIIRTEILQLLLRTWLYKDWLLQNNTGCSYPVIMNDDVMNLYIPLISDNIQKDLAARIEEARLLRNEAERLLEEAKFQVEQAIETA